MKREDLEKEISCLEDELLDLKKRWPAHSVKVGMVQQLEALEERLEELRGLIKENDRKTTEE